MNSPLIYEVHVELPAEIFTDYMAWLREHVDEMLSLKYFTGADILEAKDLSETANANRHLKVHYKLANQQNLDDYLKIAAPALRGRLPERFRSSLRFSRYALTPIQP